MGTIGDFGTLSLKWDPKNLEIRTMSVEKTLEPLVLQVTTLVNTNGPSKKKKGLPNARYFHLQPWQCTQPRQYTCSPALPNGGYLS